eukprot:scaffold115075_cov97-Cyclotella_meneghiniana.AAC.1
MGGGVGGFLFPFEDNSELPLVESADSFLNVFDEIMSDDLDLHYNSVPIGNVSSIDTEPDHVDHPTEEDRAFIVPDGQVETDEKSVTEDEASYDDNEESEESSSSCSSSDDSDESAIHVSVSNKNAEKRDCPYGIRHHSPSRIPIPREYPLHYSMQQLVKRSHRDHLNRVHLCAAREHVSIILDRRITVVIYD